MPAAYDGGHQLPRVRHHFEQGGYYHITTRTLDGRPAFATDETKREVVHVLRFYRERGDWRVFGFVVMINHVHIVASQTGRSLSEVVRDFKTAVFHRVLGKGDKLWERRFDDNAIQHETEMGEVLAYVHHNPVRAGVVIQAEDYFWSSARNYVGLRPVAMEIDTDWR